MSAIKNELSTIKNIVLTLLCIIAFSFGCDTFQKDEYYHLTSNCRSLLRTGDTLVFLDNKSEQDTFKVFKKIKGTYRISLSGSSCKSYPSAYFDAEFLLINRFNEQVNSSSCIALNDDTMFGDCEADYVCKEAISIGVWATDTERDLRNSQRPRLYWYGDGYKLDSIINKMTVLQYSYDSVFHFSSNDALKHDFKEINYTYKYGIIQMNEFNGNVLKLKRK